MGYGRYIGYVGALAVALGVGAAVATTPGIAYALPAESSSESPSTGESSPAAESSSRAFDNLDVSVLGNDGWCRGSTWSAERRRLIALGFCHRVIGDLRRR